MELILDFTQSETDSLLESLSSTLTYQTDVSPNKGKARKTKSVLNKIANELYNKHKIVLNPELKIKYN